MRNNEFVDTKEVRLIRCVDGLVTEIPSEEVNLKINYSNGLVLLGVINHLPQGVDLLTGNDLDLNPTISNVNVITRSQSKKLQQVASNIVSDNTANCNDKLSNIANVDVSKLNTKVDKETDFNLSELFSDKVVLNTEDDDSELLLKLPVGNMFSEVDLKCLNHTNLVKLQRNYKSLNSLHDLVVLDSHNVNNGICFMIQNDVLDRKCRNKSGHDAEFGLTQIVVPTRLREKILFIAHDIPASGYLDMQKTLDRLKRNFWWPGMCQSIRNYCRTCDTCQKLDKGNLKSKAPLINLPVISEPWS